MYNVLLDFYSVVIFLALTVFYKKTGSAGPVLFLWQNNFRDFFRTKKNPWLPGKAGAYSSFFFISRKVTSISSEYGVYL